VGRDTREAPGNDAGYALKGAAELSEAKARENR
jgi:hypothetical protein